MCRSHSDQSLSHTRLHRTPSTKILLVFLLSLQLFIFSYCLIYCCRYGEITLPKCTIIRRHSYPFSAKSLFVENWHVIFHILSPPDPISPYMKLLFFLVAIDCLFPRDFCLEVAGCIHKSDRMLPHTENKQKFFKWLYFQTHLWKTDKWQWTETGSRTS